VEGDARAGEGEGFWAGLVEKFRGLFSPKERVPAERPKVAWINRAHPEGMPPCLRADVTRFGRKFPDDYPNHIPKRYRQFFTRGKEDAYADFCDFVEEALMIYENKDFSSVEHTIHQLEMQGSRQPIEFPEHCIGMDMGEGRVLLLGNTYFQMTPREYNENPQQRGYFIVLEKLPAARGGEAMRKVGGALYRELPNTQWESSKGTIYNLLHRAADAMPDENREKQHVLRLVRWLAQ
jgi:hypothetical protein